MLEFEARGAQPLRRRQGRRVLGAMTATSLVGPMALLMMAAPAQAASASITNGGYTSGGTTYAKSGDVLTLSVSASEQDRCVVYQDVTDLANPVLLGSTWNENPGAKNYTFNVTAGAGDLNRSVRATPYERSSETNRTSGTKTTNVCDTTRRLGSTASTVSYRAANTKPTITGSHVAAAGTPAAQNGWYRGDVVVNWTCASVPAALGLDAPGCPSDTVTGEGNDLSRTKFVKDKVGNENSASVSGIKIDRTAPLTTADAPSGWQTNGVTVTLTASDNLSTVAKTEHSLDNGDNWTTGTSIQLGEGRHTLKYRSTDGAGNVEAVKTALVDIDVNAPTINSSQSPNKPTSGWNKDDVTVTFTCGDNLSGVKSCSGPSTVTAEGTTSVPGAAEDNAGNTNTVQHDVSIDRTAPTVSGALSGTLGLAGWYTNDVGVAFTCTDPGANATPRTGSGVASCTGHTTLTTEGANLGATGNAVDNAGNSGSGAVSGVKIDKTPPTTTSNAPSGWQGSDVTVDFTAIDQTGLSGVDYTQYSLNGGTSWTSANSVTLSDEGVHNLLFRSVDAAGNDEQSNSATVSIDKSGPTVTDGSPTTDPNSKGWYSTAVENSFTAEDTRSGLAAGQPAAFTKSSGTVQGSAVKINSGPVADAVGNTNPGVYSAEFKIDLTPPTLSGAATTAANDNGWYKGDVEIAWTGQDQAGLSGIDAATQPANSTIAGEGANLGAGPVTVKDNAGNTSAPASVSGINIDRTAPSGHLFDGIAAQSYTTETVPASSAISCTATDTLSTLDSCVVTGYADLVGSHTLTATATDKAGNTSTSTLAYSVTAVATAPAPVWKINGFDAPIGVGNSIHKKKGEAAPTATSSTVWNTAKGGSTIPLKFTVAIDGVPQTSTGTDVVKSFTATKLSSCSGTLVDGIEELGTTGITGLKYDATAGQYVQTWKTGAVSSNTCYRVALTTADESVIYTFVQLRK